MNYFHFTKGQKRGVLLFILLVAIAVMIKWGI